MKRLLLVIALVLVAVPVMAATAPVTLAWDAPDAETTAFITATVIYNMVGPVRTEVARATCVLVPKSCAVEVTFTPKIGPNNWVAAFTNGSLFSGDSNTVVLTVPIPNPTGLHQK